MTYATEPDQLYYFGPVIFWAFAEMTCGFVIACLPSTPKILKDSGVLPKAKRAMRSLVGLKNSTLRSTSKPMGGTSVTNPSSNYRKIDEYGVPLKDLQPSESTEKLRDDSSSGKMDNGIVRTTRVTVKQEYVNDAGTNAIDHHALWRNQDKV